MPGLSTAKPATTPIVAAAKSDGLLAGLGGIASGITGSLANLATGGLAGALGGALADVPMSATSGGSFIASGPTIGAKVVGGKGVSAGTSATQDATASTAQTPAAVAGLPAMAGTSTASPWNTGTIVAVAVAALALLLVLFQPSSRK